MVVGSIVSSPSLRFGVNSVFPIVAYSEYLAFFFSVFDVISLGYFICDV